MKHLSIILSGLVVATAVLATDWPQWRGPNRDGISTEKNWSSQWPATGPQQLWKTNVGLGCSAITVSQGRAYTLGNAAETDSVVCFDAATGAVRWKHSYPCPLAPKYWDGGTLATPTVDGDRVYTLSKIGDLFCLQADTGKVLWQKQLVTDLGGKMPTWGFAGSPFVLDRWVLLDVGAPEGAFMALDKLTGTVVWKNGNDPVGYSTPTLFTFQGKPCLAVFNGFGLVVHELNGGREIARFAWKTTYEVNAAVPIVVDDKIFISSGYGTGCALLQLKPGSLTALWQNKAMRNHFASCVLWQDHLYGFDESTLTCLEFATGTVKWKEPSLGKGALLLADGKLIIQSEKGDLVIAAAEPAAYKEIARAKVLSGKCWVVPVLANGRLYMRNNAGDLVCLDVAKPK